MTSNGYKIEAGADLWGANLRGAELPAFQIVPEVGEFVAYKAFVGGVIGEEAEQWAT